jgi:RNA polymerase sigma-70 factor (ECF subfamily)
MELAPSLLAELDEPARAQALALADLEARLAELWQKATREETWLPANDFCRHLGARLAGTADFAHALANVYASDLLLACACARGNERALAAFEARYFDEIDRVLDERSFAGSVDDLQQLLREKLFVGGRGRAPAIADYAGRGGLRNWFRMAVVRTVINLETRAPKDGPGSDDELARLPWDGLDPELGYLKARYRVELEAAFVRALERLERRERNLLRYTLVDQLTVSEVATIYGVHASTMARWLAEARTTLLERLKGVLTSDLQLSAAEFDSLLRLVRSRIEVTLLPLEQATPPPRRRARR